MKTTAFTLRGLTLTLLAILMAAILIIALAAMQTPEAAASQGVFT